MIKEQLYQLLDSYVANVIHDYDKPLFIESVKAAKASAIRSAYIMLWLSCMESLRRKLQELAVHDTNIVKWMGELATLEAEKRHIDQPLLNQAKEYGLISSAAFNQLEHIYTTQHRYHRPYGDIPNLEEFVADASIVIENVLSQPTRLVAASQLDEHFHRFAKGANALSFMLKQRDLLR